MVALPPRPDSSGIASYLSAVDQYATASEELVAELQAKIDELTKPPSGGSTTLFGCSRPDLLPDGVDLPVGVCRTYLGAGKRPTNWQNDNGIQRAVENSAEAISLSFKDTAGSWLDSLCASLESADRLIYLTDNHEPYSSFIGNPSAYHKKLDASIPIMRKYPYVIPTVILDGSHPESWNTFDRDDVDVHGVDRYNPGIQSPAVYQPPSEVFGPYLDWLGDREGLIGETGTGLVRGDENGRAAWSLGAHNVLALNNIKAAMWWLGSTPMEAPASTINKFLVGA